MLVVDLLRAALDLTIAGKAGRTGRGKAGPNGLLLPEYRDPISAVTDRYWIEHSIDIAHDAETERACAIRDTARREALGRCWAENEEEQVRALVLAVAMASRRAE